MGVEYRGQWSFGIGFRWIAVAEAKVCLPWYHLVQVCVYKKLSVTDIHAVAFVVLYCQPFVFLVHVSAYHLALYLKSTPGGQPLELPGMLDLYGVFFALVRIYSALNQILEIVLNLLNIVYNDFLIILPAYGFYLIPYFHFSLSWRLFITRNLSFYSFLYRLTLYLILTLMFNCYLVRTYSEGLLIFMKTL